MISRRESANLRSIVREEVRAALDELVQPVLVALLAARQNTQGVCGTAREAPTASSSGDAMRVSDSTPTQETGGAALPAPPVVLVAARAKRRARVIATVETKEVARLAPLSVEPVPAPPVPASAGQSHLPIAYSREGCARCGVRGDIGCAHQRPFGTRE